MMPAKVMKIIDLVIIHHSLDQQIRNENVNKYKMIKINWL